MGRFGHFFYQFGSSGNWLSISKKIPEIFEKILA